jgi:hypothetical protein
VTFKSIIDDAAERLGNNQPEARVRFRRYINEWYHRILADTGLPRGTVGTSIGVLVPGTAQYTLPATIGRIQRLYSTTDDRMLREASLDWIREQDPENTETGQPTHFAYVTDRVIKLYPAPAAADTIKADHDATITEMDEDADVPSIPEDFHYLLSLGIRINEHEKTSDDRLKYCSNEMIAGIGRLRNWLAARLTNVQNPGNWHGTAAASRLGSWFPKGS